MSTPLDQAIVLGIDLDAREARRVAQRLDDAAPLAFGEVDVANRFVLEGEPVVADHLDGGDVHHRVHVWQHIPL